MLLGLASDACQVGRDMVTTDYTISFFDDKDQEALSIIGPGIHFYNQAQAGENHSQPLCLVLRDAEGTILGGLVGATYWGWLYVDLFWLPEGQRGQGYGREILQQAEEEARHRGCTQAYLDTFSFQAPGFYEKLGYEVYGELDAFPEGFKRYWMKKAL